MPTSDFCAAMKNKELRAKQSNLVKTGFSPGRQFSLLVGSVQDCRNAAAGSLLYNLSSNGLGGKNNMKKQQPYAIFIANNIVFFNWLRSRVTYSRFRFRINNFNIFG
jgi:hypothetical protein